MTAALWSDVFNEVLAVGGMPIGFDSEEQAEQTATLYPAARMRVIEVDGGYWPPDEALLSGRALLVHRDDS